MEANGEEAEDLMGDVKGVDWLPLDAAVERLSRGYERAFLANVGPLALASAALAQDVRRPKAERPAPEKRRARRPVVQRSPIPISGPPPSGFTSPASTPDEHPSIASEQAATDPSVPPPQPHIPIPFVE